MGLKLLSLSSGSRGNCLIVASNSTSIIVDVGVGIRTIMQGLKMLNANINNPSILITHTHYDHISKLPAVSKRLSPNVFCCLESFLDVKAMLNGGEAMVFEGDFYVGDITVSPFCVCHDCPCVGYSFYHQGSKISILTDLGELTDEVFWAIEGSDLIFIEANHDEDMLKNNPNYPLGLKRRILSGNGHLSNRACAEAVEKLFSDRLTQVVLGHLSQENNYPTLAKKTVEQALSKFSAKINVDCALQGVISKVYTVGDKNEA